MEHEDITWNEQKQTKQHSCGRSPRVSSGSIRTLLGLESGVKISVWIFFWFSRDTASCREPFIPRVSTIRRKSTRGEGSELFSPSK